MLVEEGIIWRWRNDARDESVLILMMMATNSWSTRVRVRSYFATFNPPEPPPEAAPAGAGSSPGGAPGKEPDKSETNAEISPAAEGEGKSAPTGKVSSNMILWDEADGLLPRSPAAITDGDVRPG
jgi:hypothetical protein